MNNNQTLGAPHDTDLPPQSFNGAINYHQTPSNLHTVTEATIEGSSQRTPHNSSDEDNDAEIISTPRQPSLAMSFDSMEAATEHYRLYARRHGFGIRYEYRRKSEVDGEVARVSIVCSRAGKKRKDKEDMQNVKSVVSKRCRNKTIRIECPARMFVKRRGAVWVVTEFNDDHNHPLVNKWSLTAFMRSHRNIPEEEKEFIRLLHNCNLQTSRQMKILADLHGSLHNVPYKIKDVANYRASLRLEHRLTDMQDTISYFQKLKSEDSDFFYKIKLDEDDRVENIYWIDGPARRAYKYYSDCISFDTTYLTNIYKMPCAPFIGINNHGQSIQFGCGFMRTEVTDSFVWLFETFLEAMGGVAPAHIITDQDFAMRNGIDRVFPDAIHRHCRWHIMKKAQEKLGAFMGRRP